MSINRDNEQFITNERVRILYENTRFSGLSAIALACLFAYIFKEQIAAPILLGWLGSLSAFILLRYWLNFNYRRQRAKIQDHRKFENRLAYFAGLTGISWAFIIIMGLNLPVFEYRIYSLLLLVGVIAIAMPVFAASIKALYFYSAPSLATSIPLLWFRGGDDTVLGFVLFLFAFLVIRSGKSFNNDIVETLSLRFQTDAMAKDLRRLSQANSESERRMQELMDYAPAAIYAKNLDGQFTFLNQKVAELHQIPREDILGKTLYDILPRETADEIHANDLDVIDSRKAIQYEESASANDELRHYISIKFPLFDKAGTIYGVGGVSTDITERFRAEDSLRISQQRLLLHREQSPVGVIEWNTAFEFLDWNPAAEKIFGFTRDEVKGHHITEKILPDSARLAVDKIWEELLANRGGTYSLNENTTKDGRTILCEWHNTPLVDHHGKVIGVTSLVEDVTTRQYDEEKLRHGQKMDALGSLTGGIAHDFNNALGIILGYAELLHKSVSGNPDTLEYINEIIQAGERSKNLTSKLLAFSSRNAETSEKTDINQLLQSSRNMLEKTLTPRIGLRLELDPKLWSVYLDKNSFEDAILNMSINAMHAMPNGGSFVLSTSNVELTSADVETMDLSAGEYVSLTLADSGIGMSDEVCRKVFDPFFSTKGMKGTGLGMSQVYGFVQQSDGAISVHSAPGHGTRITIYFPRLNSATDSSAQTASQKSIPNLVGNETILVVDDESAIRELARLILKRKGYRVILAENGKQALEFLSQETVDLLLSDVIMPEMDGHQLAQQVLREYPQVKIQLMSGYNDMLNSDLVGRKLDLEQLNKPFNAKSLLSQIRKLLDGRG